MAKRQRPPITVVETITKRDAALEVIKAIRAVKNMAILAILGCIIIYGMAIMGIMLIGIGFTLVFSMIYLFKAVREEKRLMKTYHIPPAKNKFTVIQNGTKKQ